MSETSAILLPFPRLLAPVVSIIILPITPPIPKQILPHPLPNHQAQRIRNPPHHPRRPPRKRQTHLRRMQEEQQLRQTRRHTLALAVVQVRIQVAEEALADAVFLWLGGRTRGRDGGFDTDLAGGGAGGVGAEGVACTRGYPHWLRGGRGDGDLVAFEGEDVAAFYVPLYHYGKFHTHGDGGRGYGRERRSRKGRDSVMEGESGKEATYPFRTVKSSSWYQCQW